MSVTISAQARRDPRSSYARFPRNADARRYLASLLVTSRYHVASRPMSVSNQGWFRGIAEQSDVLLDILQAGKWEPLSATIEEGLKSLRPIAALIDVWLTDRGHRRRVRREWRAHFNTVFGGLHLDWSRLQPSESIGLADWPTPATILFAVGSNIGIGDQIIFFPIVEALSRRYPQAEIRALSGVASVWELCPSVARPPTGTKSLVGPPAAGLELLAEDPDALVVFAEFASAPFYRNLESVPGLERFVYIDSGARCVRIVDQGRRAIREMQGPLDHSIFQFCCDTMNFLEVGSATPAQYGPVERQDLLELRDAKRVYLNPFSSKDHSSIPATFWSKAVDRASEDADLEVMIFAGTNEACRAFAEEIRSNISAPRARATLHGGAEIPSVAETVREAAASDVVFGLDTFTAHVNLLSATRALVVFFDSVGGSWDAWRSPHTGVLNASLADDPATVGALLGRLLTAQVTETTVGCAASVAAAVRTLQTVAHGDVAGTAAEARVAVEALRSAVRTWANHDGDLFKTFVDVDPAVYAPALRVLHDAGDAALDDGLIAVIDRAVRLFCQSNLFRYAKLTAQQSRTSVKRGALSARLSTAVVNELPQ